MGAGDGALGLPALGLTMWLQAADGTHGGSLPALSSHGDTGSWVQFGRTERDFPVGAPALGWMRMAKTQKRGGDGAVEGGDGKKPPPLWGRRRG